MAAGQAIALGILQGLTEFLPVSSSGHLVLGQHLLGFSTPEILFDVVLHLGTLLAVVIIFFREIMDLVYELLMLPSRLKSRHALTQAWKQRPHFRMLGLIVAGSIPTALIGLLFKDWFESLFASPLAVGLALIFTGLVLFFTRFLDYRGRRIRGFGFPDAVVIGVAQGLAITPGVSRSGLTISTGLFLGLDRELAARYSFILSIPAILGALILELSSSHTGTFGALELTLGFLAALGSGLMALVLLLRVVRKGKLHYFSFYCWLVGIVAIISNFHTP